MTARTERIRTHLTPLLLRLPRYEETGDLREIALIAEAAGRLFEAAVLERLRAFEDADVELERTGTEG